MLVFATSAAPAAAQTTFVVTSDADLRAALATLGGGDRIVFGSNVSLTQDLPGISSTDVVIDGNGFTLSGAGQYRGFVVGAVSDGAYDPASVTIRNLTIRDTLARGGDGGDGVTGGGGGAGLGGAIFVMDQATVTVSNVSVLSSRARGGDGGDAVAGALTAGGGGGLGGDGGTGGAGGGGGGGAGRAARGGATDAPGQDGILAYSSSGGAAGSASGGNAAGGGAGGDSSRNSAGGGGGDLGDNEAGFTGGAGGFGGGGGGAGLVTDPDRAGGNGGFGGGGGGGPAGDGGFGGGAGGGASVSNAGGFGGGSAAQSLGGGGGAGMGGAVFVQGGGSFVVAGAFSVNGSAVAGGAGGAGAAGGSAFGAGLFLEGSGDLEFTPAAGQTVVIADGIADVQGVGGSSGAWNLRQNGSGQTILRGDNRYSGDTFVLNGTLTAEHANAFGAATSSVYIRNATLDLAASGTYAQTASLWDAATIRVAPGRTATWAGQVVDTDNPAALLVRGGGTLSLTAANTFSGGVTVVDGSTLAVNGDAALGGPSSFTGLLGNITLGNAASNGTLLLTSGFTSGRGVALGGSGGGIGVAAGNSAVWSGVISGAGAFTKSSGGTLTLTGANTYAGATTVDGGTLRAGTAGVFGSSGVMRVNGGGTLDLNGFDSTFNTIAGDGNVALGSATLTTNEGGTASLNGIISGSGRLVKNGTGTLTLGGANTYGGGTLVNGGTLAGTTTSLQGAIVNNASVVFNQASSGTYAGAMSGSGTLVKSGTGTVTLAGANTYSGGTVVNGGVLAGTTSSLRGAITTNAGAQTRFDVASDAALQATLAGTGSVVKAGAGRLAVSGANPMTGVLAVEQGGLSLTGSLGGAVRLSTGTNLALNGTVGGAVTVDQGATFTGSGAIGGLNLAGTWTVPTLASAAISPVAPLAPLAATAPASVSLLASDPTLLTVNGDLVTTPGSTVNIEATPGPKAPVQVNGSASFSGTQFNVAVNDSSNRRLTSYALVSASQVSLANSVATTTRPNLVPSLFVDPGVLRVSILDLAIPLAGVGTSDNGRAVGGALDRLKPGIGELGLIIRNLAGLPDPELAAAFEQLAGQVNVTDVKMAIIDSEAITDLIRSEVSASADDDDPRYLSRATRPRWWANVVGQRARYRRRTNLFGALVNAAGAAGGFDVKRTDRFTFGVGGSLSQGGLSLQGLDEASDMIAPRGFGYAGVRLGTFRVQGGGSAAWTSGSSERQIRVAASRAEGQPAGSAFDRTAQSDQEGTARDAWTEFQDSLNVKSWRTEGKVGWRRARFTRKAFAESGAGPLSLVGTDDTLTSTEADVLVRVWRREGAYRPHFLFSFRRQLGDDVNMREVQFGDTTNGRFTVTGLPLAQNTVLSRTGLTVRTGSGLEYTLQYEFRIAESEQRHTADFRIRFR